MSASEYGDHVHRSPAQRHRAKRKQQANRAERKRAVRMRQAQADERARIERATPSPPRCICLPEFCYGVPGESDACTACVTLDVELPCLREAT